MSKRRIGSSASKMQIMKKFLFLLVFLIGSQLHAQTDAISQHFRQYLDDERFTVVYVSGKLFQMFRSMDIDLDDEEAEAILEVVQDMKGLRLLTTDVTPQKFYNEAKDRINTREYELLMTVRSKGNAENVEFLIKDEGELITELLLLVSAEDNFVLMSFEGLIDLSKIGALQEAFEGQ